MTGTGRAGSGQRPRSRVVLLENSIELRRPAEEVFDYLSDIRNEREWNPTVKEVELLTPEPIGVGSQYRARWSGGPENTVECLEFDRPRAWVHVSDSKSWHVRFGGTVSEVPGGTRFVARMELSAHGAAKLLLPIFRRFMQRQEKLNMARVRAAMEQ